MSTVSMFEYVLLQAVSIKEKYWKPIYFSLNDKNELLTRLEFVLMSFHLTCEEYGCRHEFIEELSLETTVRDLGISQVLLEKELREDSPGWSCQDVIPSASINASTSDLNFLFFGTPEAKYWDLKPTSS